MLVKSGVSPVQVLINGCSQELYPSQEFSLYISNNTNDTLNAIEGELFLISQNLDTLAQITFAPSEKDSQVTAATTYINGQTLSCETRVKVLPHSEFLTSVTFFYNSKPETMSPYLKSMPDYYTCSWQMNKP